MLVKTVFITGATGYLGQAVAARMQRGGRTVYGLARSESGAQRLAAHGVRPVFGSLDDVDILIREARSADAVVDTASADHAPSTRALLDALAGSEKKYIRTSGTGVYTDLAHGEAGETVYTEDSDHTPAPVVATRNASDLSVLLAAERGVHSVVIRPPMVFGDGASEQLPLLIRQAIRSGKSLYVGAGENRWSNAYIADVAEAYSLALEKAPPGSLYNLAAGEARMRDIAEAVAVLTGVGSAESCTPETAYAVFGKRWVDVALASNSRVDASKARRELGWNPQGPGLLDDLTTGSYRRVWADKADPHDSSSADQEAS